MIVDELAKHRRETLVLKHMEWLTIRHTYAIRVDRVNDVPEWRSAAREAGRRLKISVRTGVSRDGTLVWASEGP